MSKRGCSENDLSDRVVLIYVKSARFQNHDTSLDETETNSSPRSHHSAGRAPSLVRTIPLKKDTVVDYEFDLTIGTLEEIRARFEKLKKP
jgi:hypothetical protein